MAELGPCSWLVFFAVFRENRKHTLRENPWVVRGQSLGHCSGGWHYLSLVGYYELAALGLEWFGLQAPRAEPGPTSSPLFVLGAWAPVAARRGCLYGWFNRARVCEWEPMVLLSAIPNHMKSKPLSGFCS